MTTLELAPDALAVLVMLTGNLVQDAEARDFLSTYGYVEDADNPQRFNLMSSNPEDEGAALEFTSEFESVSVYGDVSRDNLINLNYLLVKMGWTNCEASVHSKEAQKLLFEKLTNIELAQVSVDGESSIFVNEDELEVMTSSLLEGAAGAGSAEAESSASASSGLEEQLMRDLQENHSDARNLQIALDENEARLLESQNAHRETQAQLQAMQRDYQALLATSRANATQQGSNASVPPCVGSDKVASNPNDAGLIEVLEEYLSGSLDLDSANDNLLVKALQNRGFVLKVKLVKQAV